jgi:hypothetical protein
VAPGSAGKIPAGRELDEHAGGLGRQEAIGGDLPGPKISRPHIGPEYRRVPTGYAGVGSAGRNPPGSNYHRRRGRSFG